MLANYFRLFYLNLFIIIFIFFGLPFLLIIILCIKNSYVSLKKSFHLLEDLNIDNNINHMDYNLYNYLDYDTDSNYFFQIFNGEYYLWYNCHFFFFFYGGIHLLNEKDFLDIILYSIFNNHNLKYIYISNFYKFIYSNNYYFLYQFNKIYLKRYNLKYNLKFLNKSTYNILNNYDQLNTFNKKKQFLYSQLNK